MTEITIPITSLMYNHFTTFGMFLICFHVLNIIIELYILIFS